MKLYKTCTSKLYSFLVIDALASCNLLCFKKNLLERIEKLFITIVDKIRDQKIHNDVIREATNILVLSTWKIDKHEYLTVGEQDKSRRCFKKQKDEKIAALISLNPPNEKDELKQIENIFLQNLMNDLIHTKLNETVNLQIIIKTDELNYKSKHAFYAFIEYFSPIANLSDLHDIYLS